MRSIVPLSLRATHVWRAVHGRLPAHPARGGNAAALVGQPTTGQHRRVWISRADASFRHIRWEDDLLARLPGFEKVVLSPRETASQISLFASASIVAGPHGAGLANLAFAPAGVRLVECAPEPRWLPSFSRLAQVVGGRAALAHVAFSTPDVDLDDLATRLLRFGDATV